jgi:hypothetical protein
MTFREHVNLQVNAVGKGVIVALALVGFAVIGKIESNRPLDANHPERTHPVCVGSLPCIGLTDQEWDRYYSCYARMRALRVTVASPSDYFSGRAEPTDREKQGCLRQAGVE